MSGYLDAVAWTTDDGEGPNGLFVCDIGSGRLASGGGRIVQHRCRMGQAAFASRPGPQG